MTISTQTCQVEYTANGTQTVFDFDFKVMQLADLKVYANGALLVGGYEVEFIDEGGTITFVEPPVNGVKLKISRVTARVQELVLREFQKLPAAAIEANFDKIVSMIQELMLADTELASEVAGVYDFVESLVFTGGVPTSTVVLGVKNLSTSISGVQTTRGFYAGQTAGGGDFYYDATVSKSEHNGGTVIAPEAIAAWDGTSAGLSILLNWTGTGYGCFVRQYDSSHYMVETFGGLRYPNLCTESMQKLLDTHGKFVGVPSAEYLIRRVWFNRPVDLDLNNCTIWADVFTTSGFRADLITGIKIRNGTMKHVKTIGVYVQALTTNNCQQIVLEDLLLDGFSQFTLQFSHSIDGEYSGFALRRVRIHNAGNFFADPSSVANCCEFFNRDSSTIRTDTIIEDCEFFVIDDGRCNMAKFGVCKDTQIKRSHFKSIRRTSVGSSGIQSGATNNPLNGQNKITFEDCIIECWDTTDNYYAFDSVGDTTFIRTKIIGNGGSIYVAPKGTETQYYTLIDSYIVNNFKFDNPLHEVERIRIIRSYVYRLFIEKDATLDDPAQIVLRNLEIEDSTFTLFTLGSAQIDKVKISGEKTYIPTMGFAGASFTYGSIEVSNRARIGEVIYVTTSGTITSMAFDGAVIDRMSVRTNLLSNMAIKNCTLRIGAGLDWYINGSSQCTIINNHIIPNPDSPPTTATNTIVCYSNAIVKGNVFEDIPNRTYYITAADCTVSFADNMLNKSNNTFFASIGAGVVKQLNTVVNGVLFPSNFNAVLQDISQTPTAHYQLAIVSNQIYMSNGTVSNANWKLIS